MVFKAQCKCRQQVQACPVATGCSQSGIAGQGADDSGLVPDQTTLSLVPCTFDGSPAAAGLWPQAALLVSCGRSGNPCCFYLAKFFTVRNKSSVRFFVTSDLSDLLLCVVAPGVRIFPPPRGRKSLCDVLQRRRNVQRSLVAANHMRAITDGHRAIEVLADFNPALGEAETPF